MPYCPNAVLNIIGHTELWLFGFASSASVRSGFIPHLRTPELFEQAQQNQKSPGLS